MIVNQRRPYKAAGLKLVDAEGVLIASFNQNSEDVKQIQEFVLNALNGGVDPNKLVTPVTWLTGLGTKCLETQ